MEWRGEVKPMEYCHYDGTVQGEIIANGCYKEHRYVVVSLGRHPVAYVECKTNIDNYDDALLDELNVHGGATFYGQSYWDDTTCNYVGWDYAHWGDWNGAFPDEINNELHNKKWNTEEILKECFQAIDYLINQREMAIHKAN